MAARRLVRAEQTYYCFRIYIAGKLHLHMEGRPDSVEAWYDADNDHTVRITSAAGNRVRLRYDSRPLWEAVLAAVDKVLKR